MVLVVKIKDPGLVLSDSVFGEWETFGERIFVVVDHRLDGLIKHSKEQGHLYHKPVSRLRTPSASILAHVQNILRLKPSPISC